MIREALTADTLRQMPADEVAALFVTRRSEGLTPSEEQLLAGWLTQDAANQRVLDGVGRAWNSLEDGEDDEILAAMRAHALAARPRAQFRWERMAAAAAIVLGLAGAAAVFAPGMLPTKPGSTPAPGGQIVVAGAAVTYVSAVGEVKTVALPDGSRMTLDADSTAVGHFGPGGRSVELTRGRAFFAVAHDTSHPFTVLASDQRLTDVGTRFDVNLGPEQLTVTLLEGALAVGPKSQAAATATLRPGQQLVSRAGQDRITDVGDAAQDAASWRTGLIRFDDQSLAEAAAVMNRYSREQIVIGSPGVGALRVSGQFHAGQPEAFAETLTELYKLRSQRHGDQIELLPAG